MVSGDAPCEAGSQTATHCFQPFVPLNRQADAVHIRSARRPALYEGQRVLPYAPDRIRNSVITGYPPGKFRRMGAKSPLILFIYCVYYHKILGLSRERTHSFTFFRRLSLFHLWILTYFRSKRDNVMAIVLFYCRTTGSTMSKYYLLLFPIFRRNAEKNVQFTAKCVIIIYCCKTVPLLCTRNRWASAS